MADVRLIDANALRQRIIKDYRKEFFGSVLWNILDDMPTIDAEPVKHGRWVHFKQHDLNAVLCSVCDYAFARLHPANYCPNCGAKMDVKEE